MLSILFRVTLLAVSARGVTSLVWGSEQWGKRMLEKSQLPGFDEWAPFYDGKFPNWDFSGDNFSFALEELRGEDLGEYLDSPGEADVRCMVYKSHYSFVREDEETPLELNDSAAVNAGAELNNSDLNDSAEFNDNAMLNDSLSSALFDAINTSEIVMLGKELKSACMGADWNGRRCREVAGAIRHFTWPRLMAATTGVPTFQHLREHGKVPPLKTFRMGGGVAAEIPCRQGEGSAYLFYRHIYKSAGAAIKKNLALMSHKNGKNFVDSAWRTHSLCHDLVKGKSRSSPRPVLFTYVRDPLEKFISGYKELAARGLIDDFRGSKVGTIEHARLFVDNVFHGSCDNGHVLLQVQSMMGPSCESRFDFIGRLERFKPHWHKLGRAAGCTEKLYWPRNYAHEAEGYDKGAGKSMRAALAADGGKMAQALCVWLLPDYIAFDYPLPEACKTHADLMGEPLQV